MNGTLARQAPMPRPAAKRADKLAGVVTALALHAVAIALLLQYAPARTALREAVPLMVKLITPEAPKPVVKPDVLPKPLPVKPVTRPEPPRPTPQPVLAVPEESPVAAAVAPVVPVVEKPVEAPPAPVVQTAAPAEPVAAPKPPPVIAPVFSADYLNNPAPAYPPLARRQGQQGKVMLRVYVSAGGLAEQVEIRASSGHTALDQAARAAVLRWRFVPARQGNQPVAAWVLVPITFTLES